MNNKKDISFPHIKFSFCYSSKLLISIDDSSQNAFQKLYQKHITLIQQIGVTQMQKLRAHLNGVIFFALVLFASNVISFL